MIAAIIGMAACGALLAMLVGAFSRWQRAVSQCSELAFENDSLASANLEFGEQLEEMRLERDSYKASTNNTMIAMKEVLEKLDATTKELADCRKELIELDSDDRLRGLQERVSALLDENAMLRLQVENNDESADIENAIELAKRHDMIGTSITH